LEDFFMRRSMADAGGILCHNKAAQIRAAPVIPAPWRHLPHASPTSSTAAIRLRIRAACRIMLPPHRKEE
jgi:hypothetical protein